VLRLIATLAGWSVAVALDLSRILKWDLLFALANKTTQPGSGKPNFKSNNKGSQKNSDKHSTAATAAATAATSESNEDPATAQSKASTTAAASTSSSTGSTRNNGAVSARHLFVSIVCAFLRHDSQRTTLAILAPQGKARAPSQGASSNNNKKGGGPNRKGGKYSIPSSQVVIGRYLDRGCALAYALGAAPLAEDDSRTLLSLLPVLTDVARSCLFAHGDSNGSIEEGDKDAEGQGSSPQPQRSAGKLRELAALCLLDGYALKRLLGLLTRPELPLRTAAADLVALLLQPPDLVPRLQSTRGAGGGAATSAVLVASSATAAAAAAASDPFLRAHRRCLARALPMAVAALVQGGYLHMADSSEPRALLLKLLHRDCGGSSSGGDASLVTIDHSNGEDGDDNNSDADEGGVDEDDGDHGQASTRRQSAAGGGTLVAVAMAALGSAYAHAWDLSDVFKVDLAGTTTVWLQLNAPLPPVAAVAAAAVASGAATAAGSSAPGAAANDSGLLNVVLPPETGRRELSRALQSPNSTVLRTALMVISATLDRASRLIADSNAANSRSKSNNDITRSFSSRVPLALKARLPEVQVLVALRPKLEAAAQEPIEQEKGDPAPVVATTALTLEGTVGGDSDENDSGGEALYTLLLNTMRRYVEVLDQSASINSMVMSSSSGGGGGLGGIRFDALKVLADNTKPIASMPTLVSLLKCFWCSISYFRIYFPTSFLWLQSSELSLLLKVLVTLLSPLSSLPGAQ